MYQEQTKKDWMKWWKLSEKDIPDGLILFGNWSTHKYYKQWKKILKNSRFVQEHILLGEYNGLKIAFAVTYGPAMASELVHIFGLMGTPVVVQTGSFGGLKKGLRVGDIFVPKEATKGESVSDWYLSKNQKSDASNDLIRYVIDECKKLKLRCITGNVFTTSAMLAEKWSDVLRWNKQGFTGVDLEASATLAVAKHFKMKRIVMYSLADNLIEKSHLLSMTKGEFDECEKSINIIFDLALKTIKFVKKNS